MRYAIEPKSRKYVQGQGLMSFASKMFDVCKKVATSKATKDFAKTAGKQVAQKTAEATGVLIGSKIADKITSVGQKGHTITENERKIEEKNDIFIPPEKRAQILKDLKLFSTNLCTKYKMEYEKIHNLVNGGETMPDLVSKFTSKKLVEVHNPTPNNQYSENKEIHFKTSILRSDLCDYSDAYVKVKANVNVRADRNNADNVNTLAGDANENKRTFILKNNAPFISCITKINGELDENAENLDVVIPMYNLIEYSKNYRKTNGSLHNYYRDEPNNEPVVDNDISYSMLNSESYKYKAKITNKYATFNIGADPVATEATIIIPLKHLGNFWRELNIPLINCEVELKLKWNKNCVLISKATANARVAQGDIPATALINMPLEATLTVSNCKLYVPVVTLRAIDDNKLLNSLKTGFKRTVTWITTDQQSRDKQ